MKRPSFALWACALLLFVLCGFAVADRQFGNRAPRPESTSPRTADRHYVSPPQLVQSSSDTDATLTGTDQNGVHRTWNDLSAGKPVVVVFVKNGCPCSVEFEPYFHRVAAAYPDAVRFVTIINGDVPTARRFTADNHVAYPVLADESQTLIKRFHARHGATVVLLSASGKREAQWPGCSQEMMRELSERIARMSSVREEHVDVAGLPSALTAGCAFSQ
ncbi:MAG: redoxin family protein [Planctomycetes bacterium]|nr:redoxin family protein [Planctomycetota bacterium]